VSQYQKGKVTEARDNEWQWHRLGHMQVCTLLEPDNHATQFFTGWMPFLPPNQQRQSTEGKRFLFNGHIFLVLLQAELGS